MEVKRIEAEAKKKDKEKMKKWKAYWQTRRTEERANEKRLKTYYDEQKKGGWGNRL